MERTHWPDERIDDLSTNMNARFDSVDARFDRVDARFDRVDARFDRLEARFEAKFDRIDARFDALNTTLLRVGGGIMVGLVGVIAAILARGV